MKTSGHQQGQQKMRSKVYSKQRCQLTQFPTIKLHITQNNQRLELANKLISDFSFLTAYSHKSQHAFAQLKYVDLSHNRISDSKSLMPLATSAQNILHINLSSNPLTLNLNFLFEIMLIFPQLNQITHQETLHLNEDSKRKSIQFHLKGGILINQLIEVISSNTRILDVEKNEEIIKIVQSLVQKMSSRPHSIVLQNLLIFSCIQKFLDVVTQRSIKYSTNGYPEVPSVDYDQIDHASQYQINSNSNPLFQSSPHNQKNTGKTSDMIFFYYNDLVRTESIESKLLQQIQVLEQQNQKIQKGDCQNFLYIFLISHLKKKWMQQCKLLKTELSSIPQKVSNSITPFRSIQTNDQTQRQPPLSLLTEKDCHYCYFGLDKAWAQHTHQFVLHRFISFLKFLSENTRKEREGTRKIMFQSQYQNLQQDGSWEQKFKNLTFGIINEEKAHLLELHVQQQSNGNNLSVMPIGCLSPISGNKFIISSCLSILEQVIKRIIFRRILNANLIKLAHVSAFHQTLLKISMHSQSVAFRKIYQQSIFLHCVHTKLSHLKCQRIFLAWKSVRERKLKLFSRIINRKIKRQNAFLSITLTQWRIITRHLITQETTKRRRGNLLLKLSPFEEITLQRNCKDQGNVKTSQQLANSLKQKSVKHHRSVQLLRSHQNARSLY